MAAENGKVRRWTAGRKWEVVKEGLAGKVPVAELCRKHGITQSMYYEWKQAAEARAEEALAYGGRTQSEYEKDQKIRALERKVGQMTMDIEILKKVEEMRAERRKRSGILSNEESP